MAKEKIIKLKNARIVFPEKYTRVRAHDLISTSIDKKTFLSKNEQNKLQSVADDIRNGLFKEKQDVMITRTGRKLIIKPF